jgi:DNA-binding transcriptional LysR family regulator
MFETLINQTGISLERLAMLCEIAESGSIGAATAGNANRQSQFSRQLAELETFFGRELLDRRARPFRLNEAGRELAQLARMSLAGLEDFLARSKGASTRLVVGAGESLIQWLLLPAAIQAKPGDEVLVFKNLDTNRIVEGLHSGQLDIGLVRSNAVPEGFHRGGRLDYRYALFVPQKLVPRRRALEASLLSDVPLAVMEGRGELRRAMEAHAAKSPLHVAMECSSYPQIATAVASGYCAGVLPEFARHYLLKDVKMIDLGQAMGKNVLRTTYLIWSPKTELIKPSLKAKAIALAKNLGCSP